MSTQADLRCLHLVWRPFATDEIKVDCFGRQFVPRSDQKVQNAQSRLEIRADTSNI